MSIARNRFLKRKKGKIEELDLREEKQEDPEVPHQPAEGRGKRTWMLCALGTLQKGIRIDKSIDPPVDG